MSWERSAMQFFFLLGPSRFKALGSVPSTSPSHPCQQAAFHRHPTVGGDSAGPWRTLLTPCLSSGTQDAKKNFSHDLLWTFAQICPAISQFSRELMLWVQWDWSNASSSDMCFFSLSLFLSSHLLPLQFSVKLSLKLVSTMSPMHVPGLIGFWCVLCVLCQGQPASDINCSPSFSCGRFCWCLVEWLSYSLRKLMLNMIWFFFFFFTVGTWELPSINQLLYSSLCKCQKLGGRVVFLLIILGQNKCKDSEGSPFLGTTELDI